MASDMGGFPSRSGFSPPLICTHLVAGAAEATIRFNSLPQNYKHLKVVWSRLIGTAGVTNVFLSFNEDTTNSNYYSSDTAGNSGANRAVILITGASSSQFYSAGELTFPDYAGMYKKVCYGIASYYNAASGKGNVGSLAWDNTSAITSMAFTLGSGSFDIGTEVLVYGI